ncbi:uncharacterized protein UV8b_07404 [Ustilaginoidea virens]|uniref:Uncharacterized protein n=1 Tax=Ustilaginoidea virens TaxID=1159556 RepID=A0A063BSR5_USTVR|nr:uncharacterized protein UV8b_07404 [Ustilaginoidea virens]QUC23163.1 hypothetical protein UV8b_07404 [Ustilaginoidea virens]GAO17737.1 hypothetical protein UVI_02033390 [Ustilaginoidea virens]
MAAAAPAGSSKRKRGEEDIAVSPIKFSFDFCSTNSTDDGSGSPRSKVAHRFRGLALESGGGVQDDDDDDDDRSTNAMRKRLKLDTVMIDVGKPGPLQPGRKPTSPTPPSRHVGFETPATTKVNCPFRLPPSLDNDAQDSTTTAKSPRRKRASTPPLKLNKSLMPGQRTATKDGQSKDGNDLDVAVVDPVRAALTWHDDEITVYDPDDEDDDGTGVNGIGFRPTPAIAHSRAMRRRQQMEGYRKREEGEARAQRNIQRRGEESLSARPKKRSPARKVHFIDPDRQNMAVQIQ